MNAQTTTKRRQVAEELKSVELRAEFLRGQLAILDELDGLTPAPSQPLSRNPASGKSLAAPPTGAAEAMRQGMRALRKFTKADVMEWIRSTHPRLSFNERSWRRPLSRMMHKGEVVVLKKNVGNKGAVYAIKGTA